MVVDILAARDAIPGEIQVDAGKIPTAREEDSYSSYVEAALDKCDHGLEK